MAIPITIEKLLDDNVVEWARIEFKEGWNPDSILKTISAFANDIDNWGGGYIVVGAKESNGKVERPIKGLNSDSMDKIQKDLLRYCKFLNPVYIPVSQPVVYEGANLLLIWVPGGYERPYQCPKNPSSKNSEKLYYIRKLSSTIQATDNDIKELMSLANNIPFDDRMCMNANIDDLRIQLIRSYLSEIGSSLYQSSEKMKIEDLALNLRIANGPKEYYKPLNVGLMFFNDHPESFFPYSRIEVVNIPNETGQGMEERIFTGPIHQQLRDSLAYIKNNVIAEKIFKVKGQAESRRIYNYSFDALEEFLSNAVYHKSYQIHEPITVRIEKEKIEITSLPGPDRSITDRNIKEFKMRSRRYRNRRIGDFLKEFHLVEGRNTGIPTALEAIKRNDSPLPTLLTDDERSYFTVIVPIHPSFITGKLEVEKKDIRRRRNREDIATSIVEHLKEGNKSLNTLYKELGYSGNPSKVFREIVAELIEGNILKYADNYIKQSAKNVLVLVEKKE